jgi:hypothetical protein
VVFFVCALRLPWAVGEHKLKKKINKSCGVRLSLLSETPPGRPEFAYFLLF